MNTFRAGDLNKMPSEFCSLPLRHWAFSPSTEFMQHFQLKTLFPATNDLQGTTVQFHYLICYAVILHSMSSSTLQEFWQKNDQSWYGGETGGNIFMDKGIKNIPAFSVGGYTIKIHQMHGGTSFLSHLNFKRHLSMKQNVWQNTVLNICITQQICYNKMVRELILSFGFSLCSDAFSS